MARKLMRFTKQEIGSRGRWRKRWGTLLALVAAAALTGIAVLAVHDLDFELDGNIAVDPGGSQNVDWATLFDAAGNTITPLPTVANNGSLFGDFTNAKLDKDFVNNGNTFVTSDTTTFATGSKDTLPISGWQCNFDNNVNSKIDIMNAYATAYKAANGSEFLYFALERNTNTGDANVAFWFLQDDVNCETTGPSTTFSGAHKDGDLLIVSAFTKGGDVSTIDVYRWNGGATGSLGTTPVAHGVDCRDPNLPGGDAACAAANRVDLTGIPWLTSNFKDGVGHSLLVGEFFEGGLNLTASGLGGKCFNVFIGDTRSSQSLTATLFDYARGKLGECVPTVATQASTNGNVLPGSPVTDLATIQVTGAANPDDAIGTVSFAYCGPVAQGFPTCTSANSTSFGSAVTLDNLQCDPDSPNNTDGKSCALSVSVNDSGQTGARGTLATGNYCFLVTVTLTNYPSPGEFTNQGSECFTVLQLQPTMTTAQTWTVKDSATVAVASGAGNLTGDLRFKLYSGTDCSGASTLVYDSGNIAVSGASPQTKSTDDATTPSGSLVFTSTPSSTPAGTLRWLVTYSNTNPGHRNVTHACGSENTVLVIDNDGTANTP